VGPLPNRLVGFDAPTVWHEFTPLSNAVHAVNLGQGFPDWSPPDFVSEVAVSSIQEHHQQYARPAGHLHLVERLAAKYTKSLGRDVNAMTNIAITVGASEALYVAMQAFLEKGDEVILIEPSYDSYAACVQLAGGVVKPVPLRAACEPPKSTQDLRLDMKEFRAAFTEKTRLVLINTPHNPTGKVYWREELEAISEVVRDFPRVMVLTDEVYEHMLYDGAQHVHMATLPGMWERTVTISSAAKTFSITGWKIGWMVGPEKLVQRINMVNQWVVFCVSTPHQEAVARALARADDPCDGHPSYWQWLNSHMLQKRDRLLGALRGAGLHAITPEGAFFIMVDTQGVDFPNEVPAKEVEMEVVFDPATSGLRDYNFCRWLAVNAGVTSIPPSSFHCAANKALAANYARFVFCKGDETIDEAGRRLKKLGLAQ